MKRLRSFPRSLALTLSVGALPLVFFAAQGCSGDDTTPTPGRDSGTTDATTDHSVPPTPDAGSDVTTPEADSAADAPSSDAADAGPALAKINHVVVIYMENHSFDNLYGEFPGADGLLDASAYVKQVDPAVDAAYTAVPFPTLPDGAPADPRLPATVPNAPFNIEDYIGEDAAPPDLLHIYYLEQQEISGGKMDMFAAKSNAKGLTIGHYHTMNLPLPKQAINWTVCDRFFHAAFGGSFLNHFWLIAAQTPKLSVDQAADAGMLNALDDSGAPIGSEKAVTPDGYAVNTLFSVNSPHPSFAVPANRLVPNQTFDTIGDRLSAAGVDWAWYSEGWNDALVYSDSDGGVIGDGGGPVAANFQYHHQPFVYFDKYKDGTPAKQQHLKDENDFVAALNAGTLPAVSFVKPVGIDNEHPGYTSVLRGELHLMQLIQLVQSSPNWKDTAIIVTYDEHGGFADHVSPPKVDKWGPGSRVPTIVISPYAKKGYVDHTVYDTTSILATIEHRWGLTPLGDRDKNATDLSNAFDFSQKP
jgi:acid phosphatase